MCSKYSTQGTHLRYNRKKSHKQNIVVAGREAVFVGYKNVYQNCENISRVWRFLKENSIKPKPIGHNKKFLNLKTFSTLNLLYLHLLSPQKSVNIATWKLVMISESQFT